MKVQKGRREGNTPPKEQFEALENKRPIKQEEE